MNDKIRGCQLKGVKSASNTVWDDVALEPSVLEQENRILEAKHHAGVHKSKSNRSQGRDPIKHVKLLKEKCFQSDISVAVWTQFCPVHFSAGMPAPSPNLLRM